MQSLRKTQQISNHTTFDTVNIKIIALEFYVSLLVIIRDCYKQDLFSKFWINLYSIVFESLRLTVADPRNTSSEHDFLFNKFTAISSRLSISE